MKLSEHDMLVTLATMALRMDDLTGHDVLEALRAHGYGDVVTEASKSEASETAGTTTTSTTSVDLNPYAFPSTEELNNCSVTWLKCISCGALALDTEPLIHLSSCPLYSPIGDVP